MIKLSGPRMSVRLVKDKLSSDIILVDREDVQKITSEEQFNFIINILANIGLPEEQLEIFLNQEFSVEQKIKFRKLCETFDISVIDDLEGGVKIYVISNHERTMIAEWYKPKYVLRINSEELDRSKKFFVELHTSWWSVFDGQDR